MSDETSVETIGEVRFAFRTEGFELELRGTESFVKDQLELVKGRIRAALDGTISPVKAGETAKEPAEEKPPSPLEELYRKARPREGRGALQDSIMLFAWYVIEHQKKREFSIEDLNFCFDLLNIERPKSLANTLGILKRDRGWLESGSKRGTYSLTIRGREQVKPLID